MSNKNELICFWGGYAFFPLYIIGFALVAGFIPIPGADLTPNEVSIMFADGKFRILTGMAITIIASALLIPWAAAVFSQMLRIDKGSKVLSFVELIAGALGTVFFMVPSVIWSTLAFRTSYSPENMQLFNDFAWVLWVVSYPPYVVQFLAFGLCILKSDKKDIIFPRWLGYLSFWLSVALLPASLIVFFKTGPFAWDGLIAVYLPVVLFVIWFNATSLYVYRAIKTQ